MRIIAAIYLTIMLVNFGIWVTNGMDVAAFSAPHSYLIFGLYFLSMLALFAYVLGVRMLPRRVWQLVFVVYVAYRLIELVTTGMVLDRGQPVVSLNMVSNYLWLVLPSALAMYYLGFMRDASPSRRGHRAAELGSPP